MCKYVVFLQIWPFMETSFFAHLVSDDHKKSSAVFFIMWIYFLTKTIAESLTMSKPGLLKKPKSSTFDRRCRTCSEELLKNPPLWCCYWKMKKWRFTCHFPQFRVVA